MINGLADIVSQDSGHFQSIYVVWGLLQDGVIRHEVSGSDCCVVGMEVNCCGVGCVATEEAF